jgi:hypothetical protein
MNKSQASQVNGEVKIIVVCEKCHQKLRIPRRSKKLHVTCPTCRHEFDYQYGDEFRLITPTVLKGLIISFIMIIVGLIILPLIDSLPRHSLPDIISFLLVIMTPVGVILLIVFAILTLLAGDDITRFQPIKKIIVSDQGITLYNKKDESAVLLIGWQQIKAIQVRYLKHMFLGLVEVRQEPVAIEFSLVDGTNYRIPLDVILKEQDRLRLVSTINRYVSLTM